MVSKRKAGDKPPSISPVLFVTVDGEPMRFFLRPGPTKQELQPHIKAGGGLLCRAQQPEAILLAEAEELGSHAKTTAHRYVSTQYIRDCIEKNVQLDVEDYRLSPENIPGPSRRRNTSIYTLTGRLNYTPEEDEAILSYISMLKEDIRGDGVWKEMEKKHVTPHSWQSMKCRYKKKLADRQMKDRTEGDDKDVENQEIYNQNSSPAKNDLSPEASSSETSVAQANAEPTLAEKTPLETSEPQMTDPAVLNVMPEDSPAAQPKSLPDTPSSQNRQTRKRKEEKASSPQKQPYRTSARRQLLQESDQPPVSSSSSPNLHKDTSSPQFTRKTKSTGQRAGQPDPSTDHPPSKRPREEGRDKVTEDGQEETGQATTSDVRGDAVILKEAGKKGKRKKKRKLGILEMAAKEFEDDSESDHADMSETTDSQIEEETAAEQPRHAQSPVISVATATTFPAPESGPSQGRGSGPEDRASREDPPLPETDCPVPSEPVPSTSKAHLFIFENESQEDSQLNVCDSEIASSVDQPIRSKDTEVSLTQVHLEEDKERIRSLMKRANQDLVSVTKALLKTSGDFSAALHLLLNSSTILGPFWNRRDDSLLLSADSETRQRLQEKYGEESLAKRLIFLEGE
ncbi:telomeric repeat-binding factor 2-interacting protein 1 [Lampris incognitus]|uniref:telomeric repeat-binding factor 2-interacting protein 1 n=1 Tax=Lampris incognitus TaxID=2546036 RepID=UPI0024B5DB1F|nr:telomeric repeat-binding factor 2-interacting protein 1 [Lampris incognitus]